MERATYTYTPELNNMPLLQASFRQQNFSRHVHEEYCIGVIDDGAQRFFRSGANHIAAQNCIILVNPEQVHDGHAATENGWKYRAIYPLPELMQSVQKELAPFATGTALFADPVVEDPTLAKQLRELFEVLTGTCVTLYKETAFMNVMAQLLGRHAKQSFDPPIPKKSHGAVTQIQDYLDAHYTDDISTSDLSALTGLNPYYLTRLFQKHVGMPPHAYQIQRRLCHARRLLLSGRSQTEAALAAGFSDQSHFSRHFKRWMGIPPGSFLQDR